MFSEQGIFSVTNYIFRVVNVPAVQNILYNKTQRYKSEQK